MSPKPWQNKYLPPDGRVRGSQALTVYGPGAMADLVHDAVLVGGLDFWTLKRGTGFDEPRLRERLKRKFPQLDDGKPFIPPPAGDERRPSRECGIQVLEFPRWFVCQKASCRKLVRCGPGSEVRAHRYVHDECNEYLVPVRFVMACVRGHIDEFPWVEFVHGTGENRLPCPGHDLKLLEGVTGDFSELAVQCLGCGRRVPLLGATGDGAHRFTCRGRQPWLNVDSAECGLRMKLLVRTASNSYFAEVVTSLDIPEPPSPAAAVHEHWAVLSTATTDALPYLRKIPQVGGALKGFTDTEVLEAIHQKAAGRTAKPDEPRTAEFKRLVASETERPGDYPPEHARFFARTYAPTPKSPYPAGVARVVLAHRLREVRVQTGFTRFEARTPDLQGEYPEETLGVEVAPLASTVRWLPGIEIRGEGFLVQLDEDRVRQWEDRREVRERVRILAAGHQGWADDLKRRNPDRQPSPFYGARFYLLHSLAHLLIQAVALECGYSASAIRERIYCAGHDAPIPMAAIMFSTGTAGSEGTLGGLLEQGRAIRAHLARAFDYGRLCSNDPVCASHDPSRDPTQRFLEGAACHGCLFLAEPSCEHFNRFLDRALVVPTMGQEGAAFFRERP